MQSAEGDAVAQDARSRFADPGSAESPPSSLTNRMGPDDQPLVEAVQRDLMPMIDECISTATEHDPTPRGALEIEIDAVGDEELGAVIDAVDFPAANTIVDAELLECIRESALTMSLPPPRQGGRTEFMITMDVGGTAQ